MVISKLPNMGHWKQEVQLFLCVLTFKEIYGFFCLCLLLSFFIIISAESFHFYVTSLLVFLSSSFAFCP